MALLSASSTICGLLLLLLVGSHAFSLQRSALVVIPARQEPSTVLRRKQCRAADCQPWPRALSQPLTVLLTTPDDQDKEAIVVPEESSTSKNASADDDSRGLTKTLLLAVPLFCKFVIVLVIKMITDLVVFPLLFAYRAARLLKRKFLAAISRDKPVNGAKE